MARQFKQNKIAFFVIILTTVFVLSFFISLKKTLAAENIIYVDNTAQNCSDGSITYDPSTKSCGNGTYKMYTAVQRAADNVSAGAIVKIKAGTYYEKVSIKISGTELDPIVFEGERGPNGEWLTILDGSKPTTDWVKATDFDPSGLVYKAPIADSLSLRTFLVADGKIIPKIADMATYGDRLKYPADKTIPLNYNSVGAPDPNYWDAYGAFSGYQDGWMYLRFKNGEDPNAMDVRYSDILNYESSGIYLRGSIWTGVSYNTIRNLQIRNSFYGISVRYAGSHHNSIENNNIINNYQYQILVYEGAHDNIIRDNTMRYYFLGQYSPGPWDLGPSYQHSVRQLFYQQFKAEAGAEHGPTSGMDSAIMIQSGPNEISDNDFFDLINGIIIKGSNLKIFSNRIHNCSSTGMSTQENTYNVEIFNNIIYDNNYNLRHQWLNWGGRRIYIYNNLLYSTDDAAGTQMYFHGQTGDVTGAEYYFYHNTFAGDHDALGISGAIDSAPVNIHFINNIFSSQHFMHKWNTYGQVWTNPNFFGIFAHNWVGGVDFASFTSNSTNKRNSGEQMWPVGDYNNFMLPAESDAINSGIDVSKSFTINNRTIGPLPGFSNNYWQGSAPDMGAVEYGTEAYFKFDMGPDNPNETFIIKLNDADKIIQARNILNGTITDRVHVNGIIFKTAAGYNPPWSYNLIPASIGFFENAMEVCDATPQYVEDHLSEACGAFLPGCQWCPWDSRLIAEVYPFDNLADINNDGNVNIKDIQICVKAIIDQDSIPSDQLQKCQAVALPEVTVNIKDIQVIVRAIVNP